MTTYPASYCPDCGTALETRPIEGRERRWCLACEQVVWHNPVPTAGVAVVEERGVLVARRAIEPGKGQWSVPGGHLEADESPEVAAARELAEETGVRVDPAALELLDTFFSDHRDGKRIVSIGFVVHRADTTGEPAPGREVTEVGWFRPDDLESAGAGYLGPHAGRVRAAWTWYRDRADDR